MQESIRATHLIYNLNRDYELMAYFMLLKS
jgi:hypothetical protein